MEETYLRRYHVWHSGTWQSVQPREPSPLWDQLYSEILHLHRLPEGHVYCLSSPKPMEITSQDDLNLAWLVAPAAKAMRLAVFREKPTSHWSVPDMEMSGSISLEERSSVHAGSGDSVDTLVSQIANRVVQALRGGSCPTNSSVAAAPSGSVRWDVPCTQCHGPIVGPLFRCSTCDWVSLCQSCEAKDLHDPTHALLKLRCPPSPPHPSVCPALPPLSPPLSSFAHASSPGRPRSFSHDTMTTGFMDKYRHDERPITRGGHDDRPIPCPHFSVSRHDSTGLSPRRSRSDLEKDHRRPRRRSSNSASGADAYPAIASPIQYPRRKSLPKAEFVRDVTIPDDEKVHIGERFTKQWLVKNTGGNFWPSDTELTFVRGTMPGTPMGVEMVGPGEETVVSVVVTAPLTAGKHECYWSLSSGGRVFGHGLWCIVEVVPPQSHDVTATSVDLSPPQLPQNEPITCAEGETPIPIGQKSADADPSSGLTSLIATLAISESFTEAVLNSNLNSNIEQWNAKEQTPMAMEDESRSTQIPWHPSKTTRLGEISSEIYASAWSGSTDCPIKTSGSFPSSTPSNQNQPAPVCGSTDEPIKTTKPLLSFLTEGGTASDCLPSHLTPYITPAGSQMWTAPQKDFVSTGEEEDKEFVLVSAQADLTSQSNPCGQQSLSDSGSGLAYFEIPLARSIFGYAKNSRARCQNGTSTQSL